MTPEDRAAARARCEAATSGPWTTVGNTLYIRNGEPPYEEGIDWFSFPGGRDIAEFIAHARTDLPAALDALDVADHSVGVFVQEAKYEKKRAESAEARLKAVLELCAKWNSCGRDYHHGFTEIERAARGEGGT